MIDMHRKPDTTRFIPGVYDENGYPVEAKRWKPWRYCAASDGGDVQCALVKNRRMVREALDELPSILYKDPRLEFTPRGVYLNGIHHEYPFFLILEKDQIYGRSDGYVYLVFEEIKEA